MLASWTSSYISGAVIIQVARSLLKYFDSTVRVSDLAQQSICKSWPRLYATLRRPTSPQ